MRRRGSRSPQDKLYCFHFLRFPAIFRLSAWSLAAPFMWLAAAWVSVSLLFWAYFIVSTEAFADRRHLVSQAAFNRRRSRVLRCLHWLNLYNAVRRRIVTFRRVQCHPGLTYIFNFWHSGTLALSSERQSAWMSEIKNGGLGLHDIKYFICSHLMQLHCSAKRAFLNVLINMNYLESLLQAHTWEIMTHVTWRRRDIEMTFNFTSILEVTGVCWSTKCAAIKHIDVYFGLNRGYMWNKILFRNNFKIISVVFCFTCPCETKHWKKVFQNNSTSHATTPETEIKLFQPLRVLKLFRNYFSDIEHVGKYGRGAIMPPK